jgi:hypothetical protein
LRFWSPHVNSRIHHYRVRRRDIAFLRYAIEACDGLAFLRTLEPRAGLVALHVPPGREAEAEELMRGLASVLPLEPARVGPCRGVWHA